MTFKKNTLLSGVTALAFALAMCLAPTALHAQNQHQHAAAHAHPLPHSFTGKIMALKNGHYAIITGRNSKGQLEGHFLDHAPHAKKYVGQEVTVTGKLNLSDNTVHVTSIKRK